MRKKRISPLASYFGSQSKTGLAPGTLLHIGKKRTEKVHLQLIEYNTKTVEEKKLAHKDLPKLNKRNVQWLNIDGLHNVELIKTVGETYTLSSLLLEDVLNTSGRPKIDEIDTALIVVLKLLHYDEGQEDLSVEQVSLVLKQGLVISFQEEPDDVFDSVRERIRAGKTRIRTRGADYLLYALLDAVVDSYLDTLQHIGERIQVLENNLMTDVSNATLEDIFAVKQDILVIQQMSWPLDEIVRHLLRSDSGIIASDLEPFLRDLEDHTRQVSETIETFRMVLASMQDTYMSLVSNRMNEVMKTLTLIATIFIPLTFIAGVYGMNFAHMPELTHPWGYPGVWGVMVLVAGILLAYFKRKKWL